MSPPDRKAMLDRAHPNLSIRRQCVLVDVARSGFYRPAPANDDDDLALMRRLDELYMKHPFLGSRRMAQMLSTPERRINRKRTRRLMRQMGLVALGPKRNTSKPEPAHKKYPYLLRNLAIYRPNHVLLSAMHASPAGQGGGGYHLHSERARHSLSRRDHRLGEPGGTGLAPVEHHGRRLLPGGSGRSPGALRQAGSVQQ
jgi:hypothetical protein